MKIKHGPGPIERIRDYLFRRNQARGLDKDHIHSFDLTPEHGYILTATDVEKIAIVADAARTLVQTRGRFHTEAAYKILKQAVDDMENL